MEILLFGANGQVGWELRRSLCALGAVTALGHREADLAQPLRHLIASHRPDVIVNAAAYTAVDRAESEPDLALRVNAGAVGEMAQAAAELGALLVHYSTDYVFDGQKGFNALRGAPADSADAAYRESDPTRPLSAYGRSKLAGEEAIRAVIGCEHLIFRTSWVYAARGRNFARTILERARTMDELQVVDDTFGVPTSAELIADVTALILHGLVGAGAPAAPGGRDPACLGTYHLVPSGATTWHGYASYLIEQARLAGMPIRVSDQNIVGVPASTFAAPAQRPRNSRLDNRLLMQRFGLALPDWRWSIPRLVDGLARESAPAAR
jgi:dTDP-4-dehydrorhamnose reductase